MLVFFFVITINLMITLISLLSLQLRHALDGQKSLFENINIDWNLSHDEGSTDFSDDETVIEDRVSCTNFNN